jgi:hypothetical protein
MLVHPNRNYTRYSNCGFFNIIGSLEILGNIAGLTNSIRSGLHDFWYEPQNGTNPGEIFRGFGKGTYSLLQQSIHGLTSSVSSLTSALGTGLAYASGDTDFAKKRSINKGKIKPKNMADGLFKGSKKLALSAWDGISGIVKDPIQGMEEDGVKGAVLGFGQGVMGFVCKPLVGVLDGCSDLVYGKTLQKLINFFYLFTSINSTSSSTGTSADISSNREPQPIYFGQLFLSPMEFIISFRDLDETLMNDNDNNDNNNNDNKTKNKTTSDNDYSSLNRSSMHLAPLLNDNNNNNNSNNSSIPLLNDIMFQFGVVVVNFDCAVIPMNLRICEFLNVRITIYIFRNYLINIEWNH